VLGNDPGGRSKLWQTYISPTYPNPNPNLADVVVDARRAQLFEQDRVGGAHDVQPLWWGEGVILRVSAERIRSQRHPQAPIRDWAKLIDGAEDADRTRSAHEFLLLLL
jgi:hypothetical protein